MLAPLVRQRAQPPLRDEQQVRQLVDPAERALVDQQQPRAARRRVGAERARKRGGVDAAAREAEPRQCDTRGGVGPNLVELRRQRHAAVAVGGEPHHAEGLLRRRHRVDHVDAPVALRPLVASISDVRAVGERRHRPPPGEHRRRKEEARPQLVLAARARAQRALERDERRGVGRGGGGDGYH